MTERPRVYVTRRLPQSALDLLARHARLSVWPGEQPPPRVVLMKEVVGLDGLLTFPSERVDAALLAAAPNLRAVSNYAADSENIDLGAATQRGVLVTITPDIPTETCADFTFALMLAAARRVGEGVQYLKAGQWRSWGPEVLLGRDIYGATLGIVGMGRIGQAVARRAHGFGMQIVYADPAPCPAIEQATGAAHLALNQLLANSEIVSLHCPLTDDTYQLIDRDALALMRPDVLLINTAHGQLVDSRALADALGTRPMLAALDVTDPSPLPAEHPLLNLPNALVTPHMASATAQTRTRMAMIAAQNLLAALHDERPRFLANPELWGTRAITVGIE